MLRPTIAGLRAAGYEVALLAPEVPARALLGPGGSEVQYIRAWEDVDVAQLLSERAPSDSFTAWLAQFDCILAYTRDTTLANRLSVYGQRVITHDPTPPPGEHGAVWLARALHAIGLQAMDPPFLEPTDAELAEATRWRGTLPPARIAVHPGSGSPRKNWPANCFARLMRTVAASEPWLLVEGPADAEPVRALRCEPGAHPMPQLPVRLLGILLRDKIFVGNDSGLTHLAAAWGATVVALFGPTDPVLWRPLGPRVRVLRSSSGAMSDLGVEKVVEAVRSAALERPSG